METILLFLKLAWILAVIISFKLWARYIERVLSWKGLSRTVKKDGTNQNEAIQKYGWMVTGNQYLFTRTEALFYRRLEQIIDSEKYIICPKVRIADIISLKKWGWNTPYVIFNRLAQKHVDFVLLGKSDLKIKCAIELDDYTHDTYKWREKDDFKNEMFEIARIPLFRTRNAEITTEEVKSWGI